MTLPKTYGSFKQNFSPLWALWSLLVLRPWIAKIRKISKNSEKFELRILNIRIVENLTKDLWINHAKFQSPVITVTAVNCQNSKKSEKFELQILNIRIVENLTKDLWIIRAKFQPLVITVTAVNCKNLKNSKNSAIFELRISNFEYPNSGKPYQRPMDYPCKISALCDHCYGRDWQKFEKFEKFGKIRTSNFEFRISE